MLGPSSWLPAGSEILIHVARKAFFPSPAESGSLCPAAVYLRAKNRKYAVTCRRIVSILARQKTSQKNGMIMPVHQRIRMFNTRDTYPEQKLDNDLCQVVVARGTMVFVRGQIGQNLDTNESVAIGDVAGQTEQAMANIAMLLGEAGSELAHITKITIYITDPRYREAVYRVVGKWLKGVFPVSTGVVVAALAKPDWLMEIDVIAVLPDKSA